MQRNETISLNPIQLESRNISCFLKIVVLVVVAISIVQIQSAQAQVKTTFKYSQDIEKRLATAKDIEHQFKQYKKDSAKIVKQQYKRLKNTTDSLVTQLKKEAKEKASKSMKSGMSELTDRQVQTKALIDQKFSQAKEKGLKSMKQELPALTDRQEQAMALVEQKYSQAKQYSKISKKELQTMVMQNIEDRPEIKAFKSMVESELQPYRSEIDKYMPQSIDSLKQQVKGFDLDSAELWQQVDQMVESEAMKQNYYEAFMEEQKQLAGLKDNPQSLFQENVPEFDMENHPLKSAKQAGMKHFENIGEQIKNSTNKIDELKKKYTYVPDSEDLKTAKKTNSLAGTPAMKRLVFGGNFHLDIGDPLSLDFNPILGYKVNRNWTLGIGGTVRFILSHNDSTDFQYKVPTTGVRGYGEFQFFKSFLAHVEYEVLADNVFTSEQMNNINQSTQSINIGLGNTFEIYKGIKGKFLLLYNFTLNGEEQYQSPWVVRFGFLK